MPAPAVHPEASVRAGAGPQAGGRPEGCTNFRLRQLLRAVSRHYDAYFAAAGLKGTQYSLLSHVVAMAPVRPAELAQRMGLDASTLTRNLRVMIEAGWVVQGPGDDARSRLVGPTAAGRDKQAQARRCWKRAQLALDERLGVAQVAALHALIGFGLERLGDAGDEAAADGETARPAAGPSAGPSAGPAARTVRARRTPSR
jgi:DNA-binding MarR family transcriptional regulator